MSERTHADIVINAPVTDILDVIGDIAAYPTWATGTTEAEVTEEGTAPLRPRRARFVIDAMLRDEFELEYTWTDTAVSWTLVRSHLQKAQDGRYQLQPCEEGTRVTYELTADTAVPMLGMLRRKAERRIIDTALSSLKQRVHNLGKA
ncbi:SRPBCC family protein [Corynebacterium sp. TAE3-ERU12]|uniref:SRPBCC family protein n=1 Tax=Corynebacterium sp. TAE3-ERU12 TaxID=2849491 RepID=UPI001C47AB78|nr:SRPBCC family protein [Corynebacterium sp. TAE3-ERU12]MBV7296247.1 SRPBCC family protein [Corynebacterium sp. TAE3-ERU12]